MYYKIYSKPKFDVAFVGFVLLEAFLFFFRAGSNVSLCNICLLLFASLLFSMLSLSFCSIENLAYRVVLSLMMLFGLIFYRKEQVSL